jgi:hypothetical protein
MAALLACLWACDDDPTDSARDLGAGDAAADGDAAEADSLDLASDPDSDGSDGDGGGPAIPSVSYDLAAARRRLFFPYQRCTNSNGGPDGGFNVAALPDLLDGAIAIVEDETVGFSRFPCIFALPSPSIRHPVINRRRRGRRLALLMDVTSLPTRTRQGPGRLQ